MVCSFVRKPRPDTLRNSTLALARPIAHVLLGQSQRRDDVKAALLNGSTHFLPLTSGAELPCVIADCILSLAREGKSTFQVSPIAIRDTVSYFLFSVFGSDSTNRIGACYTSNMQRLLYNVAACVVAKLGHTYPSMNHDRLTARMVELRLATKLVAELAEALKGWLPVSSWLEGWTKWHALVYTLEMTNGTIVENGNPEARNLSFLTFCDEVFKHVVEEPGCVADLKSGFGWCACSSHFNFVLEICAEPLYKPHLPNANMLSTLILHAFNAPVVAEVLTRPSSPKATRCESSSDDDAAGATFESPASEACNRHAKRASASGGSASKRLRL